MAVLGLVLMVFIIHHAIDVDHHDDHNTCPLCVSLTGLIIVAALSISPFVADLIFQLRFQLLAIDSVTIDSPRKRGPPVAIIL